MSCRTKQPRCEVRLTHFRFILSSLLLSLATAGCQKSGKPDLVVQARVRTAEVVKSYPHTRIDFTQGLFWDDGTLVESTGIRSRSALLRKRLEDGVQLQRIALDNTYFGEGCTRHGDRIYQLTWKAGKCFVYDAKNFDPVDAFDYEGEGWGITSDGTHLIMSDGTDTLRFVNPEDFTTAHTLTVTYEGQRLPQLNELEWIDGQIYANVWQTTDIAVIDPTSGAVRERIDCAAIFKRAKRLHNKIDVLNGIAWDPDGKRLFVTGKNWPVLFHITLSDVIPPAAPEIP